MFNTASLFGGQSNKSIQPAPAQGGALQQGFSHDQLYDKLKFYHPELGDEQLLAMVNQQSPQYQALMKSFGGAGMQGQQPQKTF